MGTQIVAMLEIAVLGVLSGLSARRLFPSAKKIGRRLWILPCLVLVVMIVWDLFAFHFNWRVVSNDFFFGPELNIGESAHYGTLSPTLQYLPSHTHSYLGMAARR